MTSALENYINRILPLHEHYKSGEKYASAKGSKLKGDGMGWENKALRGFRLISHFVSLCHCSAREREDFGGLQLAASSAILFFFQNRLRLDGSISCEGAGFAIE